MNLVGKIFVSLIAMMSIIFFSLTLVLYASHKNWKADSVAKQQQVDSAKSERSKLTKEKADLEAKIAAEKDAYLKTISALETRASELSVENQNLAEEKRSLEGESEKRLAIITTNNATINDYRHTIETLTADLATAQKNRADYLQSLVTTVGQMHELASIRGDLEEKNKELATEYDKAVTVLNMNNLKPVPELYGRTLPFKVSGKLEAIQEGPQGLVMVSIGADDGLRAGQQLEVSRGASYLGRIEVVTTEPNRAVCRIMPEYRQGTMKEGDQVASKFE